MPFTVRAGTGGPFEQWSGGGRYSATRPSTSPPPFVAGGPLVAALPTSPDVQTKRCMGAQRHTKADVRVA